VETVLEVVDLFGRKVKLSKERLNHILQRVEMRGQEGKMKKTLTMPDEVRKSIKDEKVWLFYKHFAHTPVSEKYMVVVVKILSKAGTIITSYFTDRIKKGKVVWQS